MSLPPCAQDSVPGEVACLLPGRELHPLEAPGFAWRTKITLDINLQDPATSKPHHLLPQGLQHLVRGAAWAEAIRAGEKVLLVHCFQHHGYRALQHLILKGGDANGAHGSSFIFRDIDPADWGSPIGAGLQAVQQRHSMM